MKNKYERLLIQEIGKIFRHLREAKGISQQVMALGIADRTSISRVENGLQSQPNVITMNRMAKKLGVDFGAILSKAEDNINDLSQKNKKLILNLISFGKCEEAERLFDSFTNKDKSEEDFKYYCYIKGSVEFYKENYAKAEEWFLHGLENTVINNNTILSFIDVFLVNSYISNASQTVKVRFYMESTACLAYALKNSIEYYLYIETRLMVRMLIYCFAYFRLLCQYDVCEMIIAPIENIINEYVFYEHETDFAIEKIIYYLQINKDQMAVDQISITRQFLKMRHLKELEEHFLKRLSEISDIAIYGLVNV